MAEFLLEIGCEEIPASWAAGLADQLRDRFVEAAEREHLQPKNARALQASRRLVLVVDVAERQADREEKVWGPTLKVAKDAAGKWTPAALGFAKKNGVSADELQQAAKDGPRSGASTESEEGSARRAKDGPRSGASTESEEGSARRAKDGPRSGASTESEEGSARRAKDGPRSGASTESEEGSARRAKDGPRSGASTESEEGSARRAKDEKAGDLNLLFIKKVEGRATGPVLTELIGSTLRALNFPKRMNWDAWVDDGKGAFSFGRPIRWIVALLDGAVVPFTIFEMKNGARAGNILTSGEVTYGHRFLPSGNAGRPVKVASFADLGQKLAEKFVILDPAARAARIADALQPYVEAGGIHDDHGLPAEWRDLVEQPTILFGSIPAEFRHLPSAVLQTVLVHHQKYVPLMEGGTVARFAAVVNGDGSNGEEIVRGMGRVVTARLRDASFFYEEDRKRSLLERVDALGGVTFHRELGTYKQKAERMAALVKAMGEPLGLLRKPEMDSAIEAARLCKADLTTLMVREFTELQGVMGGIYLRAEARVNPHVAAAVQSHYLPVSIEEGSAPDIKDVGDPTTFAAVSIADKLDTLAGYFGIGQIPTGSSDPFGLRRAAQGVVRVLLDFWKPQDREAIRSNEARSIHSGAPEDSIEQKPSLRKLVQAAVAGYGTFPKRGAAEIVSDLESFLADRLRYVLVARGYPADEVDAVLGAREPDALDDPHEAWVRVKALHRVRSEAHEDFEHLATAFKRAKNILEKDAPASPDAALFQEPAERDLHAAVLKLQSVDGGYEARLRSLAGLRTPVDRFFDDVLVMAEDPKIRGNRLGLLSQALSLFYRIADISKLGG